MWRSRQPAIGCSHGCVCVYLSRHRFLSYMYALSIALTNSKSYRKLQIKAVALLVGLSRGWVILRDMSPEAASSNPWLSS